jgi:hypothetical protein
MAVLTAKGRKAIPTRNFAVPGKRAYPIQDASHARNALSRVSQFGSPAEKAQVRSAVRRKYPRIGSSSGPDNGNGNAT